MSFNLKVDYLTETKDLKQSFLVEVTQKIIQLHQSRRPTSQLSYLNNKRCDLMLI